GQFSGMHGWVGQVSLHYWIASKQTTPATKHFMHRPGCSQIGIDPQHHMVVIAHHRIGSHINGKHRRQQRQTLNNPATPMLKAATGVGILTT
ncbi:MAG: hypothetical protein KKC01_12485, partial [Gammaproteobacteria bacterium]|nr:hypothetical protein [Gammaproteobacteria bacterium]